MVRKFTSGPACFAPALTREHLARYAELAAGAEERAADAMRQLIRMVELFLETPASTLPGETLRVSAKHGERVISQVQAVPLEAAEIKRMWDAVPWSEELDAFDTIFDRIDPLRDAELRNAAYHLLWYGRELTIDREPMVLERI